MKNERYVLPALASITGIAWMAAVLLIAANPKGTGPTGDLAYDWANRAHTLALVFLLAILLAWSLVVAVVHGAPPLLAVLLLFLLLRHRSRRRIRHW